ncbi:hypothetical protein GGH13_008540 [Coemansia sp. S155-1]|nr:hypothetical protein GGH13_008540 [Coemansia sp. S155-1]
MFAYISDYILELAFALGIALIILIAARESPAPRKIGIPKAPLSPISRARLSSLSPLKSPSFTFQTLPMLLVYKIVEYLDCRSKYSFNSNGDTSIINRFNLFPLLSVSERWRKAALRSICGTIHLHSNQSQKTFGISPLVPPDDNFPLSWSSNAHLVKRVFVASTLEHALSEGFFCAALTRLWSGSVVFSAATTLILSFKMAAELAPRPDGSPRFSIAGVLGLNQILAVNFAHSLKRLVPAVADIHVFAPSTDVTETSYTPLCSLLISTLCLGGIKGVHVYTDQVAIPISPEVQALSRLAKIFQGRIASHTPFAELAYLNANTLQELNIDVGAEDDWLSLVYGGTLVSATFSRLTWLTLNVIDIPYATTWAAIDHVVPFPVLYTLKVSGGYPFDDDLLFRGNGKSMKNLYLPFCALSRNVLGRFNVLSRSGVSQMNSVHIDRVRAEDNVFVAEQGDALIRQQLRCVLEMSVTLSISDHTPQMLIYKTIEAAPSTHTLRYLDFGGLVFRVDGVINMVGTFTGLVSLACMVEDRGLAAWVNPASLHLRYFRAKYYPLNKCFRVLRVMHSSGFSVEEVARIAMHIAVVCPGFEFVDLPPVYRREFSEEISRVMVNMPFGLLPSSLLLNNQ